MGELTQKTKRFTPITIFSLVLLSVSILLELRLVFGATPLAPTRPELLPQILTTIGMAIVALRTLEIKETKILGMVVLAVMTLLFLEQIAMYLRIF
jgi:hypothetical protein